MIRYFWKRFASEVAPAVYNQTGVAMMIGEADVWGTDGPPFELPQWLAAAVPSYPLPLTVEVWGGYTLARNENGTLRKVLETDGMQAVIGGPCVLSSAQFSQGIIRFLIVGCIFSPSLPLFEANHILQYTM